MTEREYTLLKDEAERKFALARAEYTGDIEAIERVWRLSGGARRDEQASVNAEDDDDSGEDESVAPESFVGRIRSVLPDMPDPFTLHDVNDALMENFPGQPITALSSALKRMADTHEIVVVELGKGRRPSKFTAFLEHKKRTDSSNAEDAE
jgi:hypothetical protein